MTPSESSCQKLVVLLHAYTLEPESLRHVRATVEAEMPNSHIIVPRLPLHRLSLAEPTRIALDVIAQIDEQIALRRERHLQPFEEIILIGHSIGGLLARKVYLLACGEAVEAPFEDIGKDDPLVAAKPWANRVSRIVLFAAMNRGWSITHHVSLPTATELYFGTLFGDFLLSFFGKRLLIFHIRRGAPFITNLRLQWIARHKQAIREGRKLAVTIQLLGTIDDLVSPNDNIDLVTGRDFLYLDVPNSGHENVIEFDDTNAGKARRKVFTLALSGTEEDIRAQGKMPSDPTLAQIRQDVTNVIFVVHGIRDAGYWTHRIARKVESLGDVPPRVYASETSTYGYFPMIPFLLPSRRRAKVAWLMDQYVEAKALYPEAEFAYFGHSNGTYLLTYALENYRACRFTNVVFAGSVVRKNYNWADAVRRGQVGALLNYVATADWVVAWFPGALEILRLQDLGTAGHNGFTQAQQGSTAIPLFERRYLPGRHGAGLVEGN